MTQDFAKPSTTRSSNTRSSTKKTPGRRSNESASPGKPKKQKPATKHANTKKPMQPSPQSKTKPLIIFASMAVAVIFVASLYFLNKVPPSKSPLTEPTSTAQPKTQKKAEPAKERFNFYDILPESEIIPPKVDEYKYTEKGKATKYQYILQTGSFRSLKDAERQRATIGFQGLKGRIEKTASKGSTWYRVQVGPYYSRSKMNGAMDKLVAINIQPLVRQSKR